MTICCIINVQIFIGSVQAKVGVINRILCKQKQPPEVFCFYKKGVRRDTPYLFVFHPNMGKYGLEKTPYLDTFHAVRGLGNCNSCKSLAVQTLL